MVEQDNALPDQRARFLPVCVQAFVVYLFKLDP